MDEYSSKSKSFSERLDRISANNGPQLPALNLPDPSEIEMLTSSCNVDLSDRPATLSMLDSAVIYNPHTLGVATWNGLRLEAT